MQTLLYCVTCASTGKLYVGITASPLLKRWRQHVYSANNPKCRFHAAIQQYGSTNFLIEELFPYPTRELAIAAEIALIEHLDLINCGYNAIPGGDVLPSQLGRKRSSETIAKLASIMIGKTIRRGAKHSPESIAKMSASKKGIPKPPRTPEHLANLAASLRNMRPEARANVSAAAKLGWIKRRAAAQYQREQEALFIYS